MALNTNWPALLNTWTKLCAKSARAGISHLSLILSPLGLKALGMVILSTTFTSTSSVAEQPSTVTTLNLYKVFTVGLAIGCMMVS